MVLGSQAHKLSVWQLICLNALSLPIAMAGLIVITIIPTYYATDLGLGLAAVGIVFVAGRLLDVITDPLIGFFSDQTRTRFGSRIPYIFIGLPAFCLAVWLLFSPPETPSLIYLILASGAYFLFYTLLDVPYSSVALEISPYPDERSVIAGYKGVFQIVGAITAALIPSILALSIGQSLPITAQAIFVLSMFCLILFWIFVPRRYAATSPVSPPPRVSLIASLKTAWAYRPYRHLVGTFFIVQIANSLTAGLTMLFVTHVIGRADLVGLALGTLLASTALFLPLWVILSRRLSKPKTWAVALMISIFMLALVPFLGTGDVVPALILCVIIGGSFGCDAIMPTSMLADIVYTPDTNTQAPTAGLYLAIKNAVSKLTFLAPMGLAFPILGFIGFNTEGETEPAKLFTLVIFYAILPLLLRVLTLFFVLRLSARAPTKLEDTQI